MINRSSVGYLLNILEDLIPEDLDDAYLEWRKNPSRYELIDAWADARGLYPKTDKLPLSEYHLALALQELYDLVVENEELKEKNK